MTIVTLGLYLAVVSTPITIFGDISIQNNPVTQHHKETTNCFHECQYYPFYTADIFSHTSSTDRH